MITRRIGTLVPKSNGRLIVGLGGLYVAQSIIGAMIFAGLPAVMRQSGASLNEIAFTLLAVLPWSLKFLWAPAVERFQSPHGGLRRSRLTVGIVSIFSVGAVIVLGLTGPTTIGALAVAMVVATSASATIDIACDGHAVESFAEKDRGWANAAQIGGAYLGTALGGGVFLIMLDYWTWRSSSLVMAGLLVLLALPFLLTPDGAAAPRRDRPSPSLMRAFKRPDIRSGLILVALYVFGQKWAMTMIGPFLIDMGMSLTLLGILNGVGITVLGVAGAVGGGYLVRRFGAHPVMLWTLPVQTCAMMSLTLIAYWGGGIAFTATADIACLSLDVRLRFRGALLRAHGMRFPGPGRCRLHDFPKRGRHRKPDWLAVGCTGRRMAWICILFCISWRVRRDYADISAAAQQITCRYPAIDKLLKGSNECPAIPAKYVIVLISNETLKCWR